MAEAKTTKKTEKQEDVCFDYKHKASFKLSDKFKQHFSTKTAGGDAISADGLVALGHVKGIWKIDSRIVQFPSAENNNTCICEATVGGYDWDPIEEKIVRVEYTDVGDANPQNCNRMVAPSFIRMASTRAIGRALRKYTNVDMLCAEELCDEDISTTSMLSMAAEMNITTQQLNMIKGIITQKGITEQKFTEILQNTFNTTDFQALTFTQAGKLIEILNTYIIPSSN